MGKNENNILNKYALAILKGLGYEVVPGDGYEGVSGLKDLKTEKCIDSESTTITDLGNYEWSLACGRDEIDADLFRGRNGEKIYIDEFGCTTICMSDGLKILIHKSDDNCGMIDVIYDGDKQLSFKYNYNIFGRESYANEISVERYDNKGESHPVVTISHNKSFWGEKTDKFSYEQPISACVPNVISELINCRIADKNLSSDNLNKGLEIIDPAITSYVEDFRNNWRSILNFIKDEADHGIAASKGIIRREEENISGYTMDKVDCQVAINELDGAGLPKVFLLKNGNPTGKK